VTRKNAFQCRIKIEKPFDTNLPDDDTCCIFQSWYGTATSQRKFSRITAASCPKIWASRYQH